MSERVKKSWTRNSSGTSPWISGGRALSGSARRTAPSCSASSSRAYSTFTSRRNETSTSERPGELRATTFSTPCTRRTASSTGTVMARCTATGEAPVQEVWIVSPGSSTSGIDSTRRRGKA